MSVRDGFVAFERCEGEERIVVAANRSSSTVTLDIGIGSRDVLCDACFGESVDIPSDSVRILEIDV